MDNTTVISDVLIEGDSIGLLGSLANAQERFGAPLNLSDAVLVQVENNGTDAESATVEVIGYTSGGAPEH